MESKREKIYDVIQDACNDMVGKWDSHLSQEAGIYEYADYIEALIDDEVDQQNATLIDQNRKLISDINLAIVMLQNPFTSPSSVIERLNQTLKDTEYGK